MLFIKKTCGHIIGIDEAGRGPLAGPLVVGGIRIAYGVRRLAFRKYKSGSSKQEAGSANSIGNKIYNKTRFLSGIKDSKQLSAKQREVWFKKIIANSEMQWATAVISPGVIDKINILRAAHRGAEKVYQKLACKRNCRALLDGSLALPSYVPHRVYIKGDERFPVISAASIIAKVIRDRLMTRLHKKYPAYGFDVHKGYGTKSHYAAIKKFGAVKIHRKTFRLN